MDDCQSGSESGGDLISIELEAHDLVEIEWKVTQIEVHVRPIVAQFSKVYPHQAVAIYWISNGSLFAVMGAIFDDQGVPNNFRQW
jgi:hypothetical protein